MLRGEAPRGLFASMGPEHPGRYRGMGGGTVAEDEIEFENILVDARNSVDDTNVRDGRRIQDIRIRIMRPTDLPTQQEV